MTQSISMTGPELTVFLSIMKWALNTQPYNKLSVSTDYVTLAAKAETARTTEGLPLATSFTGSLA